MSQAKGIASPPPKPAPKKNAQKRNRNKGMQQLGGLTKQQNKAINLRQEADIGLSQNANQMLPGVYDAYSQPFDWNSLPQQSGQLDWQNMPDAPGMDDYNSWVDSQMQNYNQAFDQRMEPIFAKQDENFRQRMANEGVAEGSEKYNNAYKEMTQGQNDARTQAYAANQGQAVNSAMSMFGAGQQNRNRAVGEGITQFDVGNQVYDRALQNSMAQRNLPLSEFNSMYGAVSGMPLQNLGYSQAQGLQQQDFRNQSKLLAQSKAGMGGGGGGSGEPNNIWNKYGFATPQEYDAYKVAQQRDQAMWDYANNPAYRSKGGPSAGSQLLGGVLGTGLGLLGAYGMKNWI